MAVQLKPRSNKQGLVDTTADLATISGRENYTVLVKDYGVFEWNGTGTANSIDIFAGLTGVWSMIAKDGAATYKVYTALFDQSETNNPSIDAVLQNTIGTFTVTRNATGVYFFTSTAFNQFSSNNKVAVFITNGDSTTGIYRSQYVPPISAVQVVSENTSGVATDGLFSNATIEIRVYN
jgi:hypothetical protein